MHPCRDLHLHLAVSATAVLFFSASVILSAVPAARAQQETGTMNSVTLRRSIHPFIDIIPNSPLPSCLMSVAEHEEEFSYSLDAENGPAHWGEIREVWSACGSGEMQSPIDLAGPRVSLVRAASAT